MCLTEEMRLILAGKALNEDSIIKMEQRDLELVQEAASESWEMLIKTPSEDKCQHLWVPSHFDVKNREAGDSDKNLLRSFTVFFFFCLLQREPFTHSQLPPHTIPLGHAIAPAPSILYPASNLD